MGVFFFGNEAMPISTDIESLELDTAAVAETQKRTQLQSTVKDIEQFLPELDKAITKLLKIISDIDETKMGAMTPKKLNELTRALSSLMEKRNAIVKPPQASSGKVGRRSRLRIVFDDKKAGVEIEE